MRKFLPLLLVSLIVAEAQEPTEPIKTPEQIQAELDQAERDFEKAKKMFNPWYTGPLITGSANNVPPWKWNIQVYWYNTIQYAQFNKNWKSKSVPNVYTINPLILVQRGLSDWLDFTIIGQWFARWRKDKYARHFGDTSINFGFQLVKQTAYRPSVRFVLGQVFPTGKFRHLNPNKFGIDDTGAGAFQTSVGLNFNKIFWKIKLHPISVRLATSYVFPDAKVKVRDFNAYGGTLGTRGRVSVGPSLNVDLGIEVSLTQKWVFANDIAYSHSWKSSFSGFPGFAPAVNGAPSSDQLSLAPAIEYNLSSDAGFIGGVWFTVAGRNSSNFVSIVLSYTQLF
ncbi:MAG: hypothetical protein JSS30_02855 [Verrucomicrobia bacterium]|nr:hypothetical protein [Verrucomicrobiota bacterium]